MEASETKAKESILLQKALVSTKLRFELDELNRNMIIIDKEAIMDKGYKNTEDIFSSMPFIGLTNTGLGKNLDIRGQGDKANTSVQILVNGIPLNMLDSSHGVTPLNTIDVNSIQSIQILPGGGAVMYGNGTRGGVVNIITAKNYENAYFSTGVSYAPIIKGGEGNNFEVDMRYGDKSPNNIYYSLGANYTNTKGPRISDQIEGVGTNFYLSSNLSGNENLFFGTDIFRADIASSPNNSFLDNPKPKKKDRKLWLLYTY
ncbi:MAG: TonB-dependent receptor plug domain-containing protein, partial [Helicobacter sp.]|nr:TonB-dependent receptor plug domain-containing protein [Helicobacter sp.]